MLMSNPTLLFAVLALAGSALTILLMLLFTRDYSVKSRMDGVSENPRTKSPTFQKNAESENSFSRFGAAIMPENESKIDRLKSRLRQAGLYRRHSSALYLGVKLVLMIAPMTVGIVLSGFGMMTLLEGVLFGAAVGLIGNVAPALWLNHLKKSRQKQMRRAMPDALDVIVVCLEGGLSLPASLAKVSDEMRTAHPLLADELSIVQREIQLGRSTGDALRQFADRFDAEELRSLASVVIQAERFGASIVNALRVHADSLRLRRYQYAEEQAQKAPVKLIFPTVLCIFPALYIVLMGPAGVQLLEMLNNLDSQ
jgi:tight adherence protein C